MSKKKKKAPFERFAAGEGELAALLRVLPPFEPPPALAERVTEIFRQAQAAQSAQTTLQFEPPAAMQASFDKLAATIQAAQAPRREAVLSEIARGAQADKALGAPVSAMASAWLEQAAARRQQVAQERAAPRRWRWWPAFAVVASTAAITGVMTQFLLRQEAATPVVAMAPQSPPPSVLAAPAMAELAPTATREPAAAEKLASRADERVAVISQERKQVAADSLTREATSPLEAERRGLSDDMSRQRSEQASAQLAAEGLRTSPPPAAFIPPSPSPAPTPMAAPAKPAQAEAVAGAMASEVALAKRAQTDAAPVAVAPALAAPPVLAQAPLRATVNAPGGGAPARPLLRLDAPVPERLAERLQLPLGPYDLRVLVRNAEDVRLPAWLAALRTQLAERAPRTLKVETDAVLDADAVRLVAAPAAP